MEWIEEQGKTLDEALEKALQRIGRAKEEVKVEILEQTNKKFFGLFGNQIVRIKVAYNNQKSRVQEAEEVLKTILQLMDIDCIVQGTEKNGTIYLNIVSNQGGLIIGRHGQTIDALQYIVDRMVNKYPRERMRIILDTENYQEKRQERVQRLARKLASQVKSTGRPAIVSPMNSHDRRIIHMTLQEDKQVRTSSRGEGLLRKIVIAPRQE